jgi:hypothetical protein
MSKRAKKKNRKREQEVTIDEVNALLAVDLNADSQCSGDTWICDQ